MICQTAEVVRCLMVKETPTLIEELSFSDMEELLDKRDIRATDYELLQIASAWVKANKEGHATDLLKELVKELDFSRMTHEQVRLVAAIAQFLYSNFRPPVYQGHGCLLGFLASPMTPSVVDWIPGKEGSFQSKAALFRLCRQGFRIPLTVLRSLHAAPGSASATSALAAEITALSAALE